MQLMFNFIKIWPIKNILKQIVNVFTNGKKQINSVAMFIMWLLEWKYNLNFFIKKDN
jgi:hypothetical protein